MFSFVSVYNVNSSSTLWTGFRWTELCNRNNAKDSSAFASFLQQQIYLEHILYVWITCNKNVIQGVAPKGRGDQMLQTTWVRGIPHQAWWPGNAFTEGGTWAGSVQNPSVAFNHPSDKIHTEQHTQPCDPLWLPVQLDLPLLLLHPRGHTLQQGRSLW